MRLFIAWIKKKLGIQSPSAYINGYRYEYDYLKSQYEEDISSGNMTKTVQDVAKIVN